jgi:hypothetical protein
MLLLIAAGIFGAGVGIAAYIGLLQTVPLYQEEVLFEVRPGVRDVRDLGANDLPQDQLVTRLGMTESLLMTQRKILESAISTPAVISTAWFQDNYVDENGTELIDEAVKDIKEELATAPRRNTNPCALRWRARLANDCPMSRHVTRCVTSRISTAVFDGSCVNAAWTVAATRGTASWAWRWSRCRSRSRR